VPLGDARTLTAIVAMALGVLAVAGGVEAIRFEAARAAAADLGPWTTRAGLEIAALEAEIRRPDADATMDALNRRHDLLTAWLAARPLSAQGWIALAAVRQSLARPPSGVERAFMMSALTGPAEGGAMAQRALLGVLAWETSAAATQARTLTDLCGLIVYDPSRLKLALSAKPAAVRAAIRQGLVDHACAPRMISAIGL